MFYRHGGIPYASQFPTQEYRGGMRKIYDHSDAAISENKSAESVAQGASANSSGADRMEIMAALAMTELGGDRGSALARPSTPQSQIVPRPVSSTPETAMGTKQSSLGNSHDRKPVVEYNSIVG